MKTPKASLTLFCFVLILAGCSTAPSTHPAGSVASGVAGDSLPSWNDGPAKNAIVDFVKTTTDQNNPNSVPLEDRIATFDQDGTTWVWHPVYSQVLFAFDRVAALAPEHPGWKTKHSFKAVLTGDKEAMDKFTLKNVEAIVLATHTGMTTEAFQSIVRDWMATKRHPRFDKHYSEMVYQPMLEVMRYLRNNGYKTYIVTGGGQDLVCAYLQRVYDIQPQQIIGSALETLYEYKNGQGILMREPKVLLDIDFARKPAVIYLFLVRHPRAAFGNSIRRPADARIHSGLWRSVVGNAGTARRRPSMPTAQPRACRIRRPGPLRKRCTTKPRRVGRSSA